MTWQPYGETLWENFIALKTKVKKGFRKDLNIYR